MDVGGRVLVKKKRGTQSLLLRSPSSELEYTDFSMVAKCCWRKEKTKGDGGNNNCNGSTGGKKKKKAVTGASEPADDKEHLLKRSSVDSSFTQSSVNSCHRHSSAYEDECDALLGDHHRADKEIIRANEEDLIDLTSSSNNHQQQDAESCGSGNKQCWSNGHRLQHSPKVTFFDQSDDDEDRHPLSSLDPTGSLSPAKPRRKHEKGPVPEKRSRSAPTKIIAREADSEKIQTVELCQRASIVTPSSGSTLEDHSRKAAQEEDYLQLEKVT